MTPAMRVLEALLDRRLVHRRRPTPVAVIKEPTRRPKSNGRKAAFKERAFPYETTALLGRERQQRVQVLGPVHAHHVRPGLRMRLVEVLVEGEDHPREIAAERLKEQP